MAQTIARNPLSGFMLAILVSLIGAGIVGYVSTYVPYLEFRLFFIGFGLLAVGYIAGRRTFLGSLGFVGTYLGAFVGFYAAESWFWGRAPTDLAFLSLELLAFVMALAAGLGGFLSGKLGIVRLERARATQPLVRRCSSCGARVGWSAHKCWSCKAVLTY